MIIAIPAAIVVAAPVPGLTQARPDFSGEWVLNRMASKLSPGADAVQNGSWHIEHREPLFRHKASFVFTGGKPFAYEYAIRSDGGEVASSDQGARTVLKLYWEAETLVFTSRTEASGGAMTVTFRYDLIDGGSRLRATEQVRGSDHDQDNVWIFDRR